MEKFLKVQAMAEVSRQRKRRFTKKHKEKTISAQLSDGPLSHLYSANPVSVVSKN